MTSAPRLTDEQRLDWLQLIRCENIGPRTFRTLLNRFGGAGAALEALPDLIRKSSSGRAIKLATRAETEDEMAAAAAIGVRFIALGEPDYPAALRAIDAAPPLIAVRGQDKALLEPAVAIVGSRNASAAGLAFTDRLGRGLGRAGFVIVSGLARGIDLAAHRASLETGTIAVLAGGHARPYPAEHAPLLDEMAEKGAVVSEMPLNWEPRGRDFPRRNRIVSGLALGTVVVEAARRSGSLITARFASEQGREVFAVPGSPLDPRSEGTNDLLREGATLCTRVEDVETALAPLLGRKRDDLFTEPEPASPRQDKLWDELDLFGEEPPPAEEVRLLWSAEEEGPSVGPPPSTNGRVPDAGEDRRTRLVSLLGPAPVNIDDLVRAMECPASEVRALLFELEVAGRLARYGGDLVALLPA
ncbi:MAG: processing protein [Methylobacteriaceae bacterium]|jgi:DNA processing protein|nr:processing protein [Methylobacteriaceae bacterium]